MEPKEDSLALGGNIELVGFRDIDSANMIVLKKIIGNAVKKFADRMPRFERFTLTLKTVHKRETSEIYEVHAHVRGDGKHYVSENEDRNLFFAVDKCVKRIEIEVFGK